MPAFDVVIAEHAIVDADPSTTFDAARTLDLLTVRTPLLALEGIDTVAGAGALYANRWHRDARRFVRRNTAALRELPVWLVSSGPLSDSAEHQEIPPTRQVAKLAKRVGARGHVTFGGRL